MKKKRRFRRIKLIFRLAALTVTVAALYLAYPAALEYWADLRDNGTPPVSVEAADYNKARLNVLGRELVVDFGDVDLYRRKLDELVNSAKQTAPPLIGEFIRTGGRELARGAKGLTRLPEMAEKIRQRLDGK